MGPSRRMGAAALAVLIVAFGVRLVAALWWQERLPAGAEFSFGDSHSYWILAEQVASGEPYVYAQSAAFRAPGYPLLLAPLFWMFSGDPPILAARVLGCLFGTLTVAGALGLGWQLFDFRTGLIAAALTAVYPGAIGMSVFVLSESPFCPLMLGQLCAWVAAYRTQSSRQVLAWSLLAGLCAGGATLVRPSWIFFTPLLAALSMLVGQPRRRHTRIAAFMLLSCLMIQVPWWVRTERATGAWVLTTLQAGASLYDGLNPKADGSSNMEFVEPMRAELARSLGEGRPPTDVELDAYFKASALAWARAHPGRVLQLAGIKLLRMWSPWPHADEFRGWKFGLLVAIGYVPLLVAGLWGVVRFAPKGWPYALCVAPAVYFSLLHMVFVSSIRYRGPAMLTLAVLAAAVLSQSCFPQPSSVTPAHET